MAYFFPVLLETLICLFLEKFDFFSSFLGLSVLFLASFFMLFDQKNNPLQPGTVVSILSNQLSTSIKSYYFLNAKCNKNKQTKKRSHYMHKWKPLKGFIK